jgi:hypothetical protein
METNEIGRLISENIAEYSLTANENNLNEIYRSLVTVGDRILRDGYSKQVACDSNANVMVDLFGR